MQLSRRGFTGGAFSFALGSQLGVQRSRRRVRPCAGARRDPRLWRSHRDRFRASGPDARGDNARRILTVLDFGYANADARTPISADTLFQIGSISKSMTATLIHQFAAEGRLGLTDRISAIMPEFPLPRGNTITVQHMLDHVAGLPGDAPLFPDGGLWTAYAPGAHWHYSNTGYEMLGKLAEHVGGKPLSQLLTSASSCRSACAAAAARSSARTARFTRRAMKRPTRRRRSHGGCRSRRQRGST